VFYSAPRQSNPPEALECRSVRFSVRQMNTLIELRFNRFKLDFILSCRLATNRGTNDRSARECGINGRVPWSFQEKAGGCQGFSNNSPQRENPACFATIRRSSPYRRTNSFFRLPQTLSSQHFFALASFRVLRVICCRRIIPTHLYAAPPLHSICIGPAPAAIAGGFLQVVVSKARKHTALQHSPCLIGTEFYS
jgi:hypothetical protein